ncbi:MAG: flagellar biosynthesis anti-sigma factor FlgM [Proteobacteria bacterium]|nr:flagellar biosynthesis anti-sigma factor FlgM [Pseudomonadota bacterium]
MKIDGHHPKLPVQDKSVQTGKEKESARIDKKRSTEVRRSDTKNLSMDRVRDKIKAEPDVNLEKVNALKAKIKKGEYRIDSEKLADNLIKNSLFEDI